ncbi:hypothetical protein KSP39_PZI018024 [Platanthera zijinensis]|uniref:Uncharacterized protein n=1 Tax=Platanthera zijinensis TaxID=2320716 RepID=A0AAP0B4K0_9ASPA
MCEDSLSAIRLGTVATQPDGPVMKLCNVVTDFEKLPQSEESCMGAVEVEEREKLDYFGKSVILSSIASGKRQCRLPPHEARLLLGGCERRKYRCVVALSRLHTWSVSENKMRSRWLSLSKHSCNVCGLVERRCRLLHQSKQIDGKAAMTVHREPSDHHIPKHDVFARNPTEHLQSCFNAPASAVYVHKSCGEDDVAVIA